MIIWIDLVNNNKINGQSKRRWGRQPHGNLELGRNLPELWAKTGDREVGETRRTISAVCHDNGDKARESSSSHLCRIMVRGGYRRHLSSPHLDGTGSSPPILRTALGVTLIVNISPVIIVSAAALLLLHQVSLSSSALG